MSQLVTPHFRVSYPEVFAPKLNTLSNKNEYSIEAVFPKGCDLSVLKKAAQEALEKKLGARLKGLMEAGKVRSPFMDQGTKAKTDETTGKDILPPPYEKGAIFMRFKSDKPVQVFNQKKEIILLKQDFYAGCWAHAIVSCYAYDKGGNCGVAFGLSGLQKVKEGDALGAVVRATDYFSPIEGAAEEQAAAATSLFD